MSFIPNMPESGSTLGNTRKLFVNELAGMRSTAAANHIDQNKTGKGKHTFSQFKSVTVGLTDPTDLALYNKNTAGGQRFFIRQPANGSEIQISGIDPIVDPDEDNNRGCTFLPGGLLLQWGSVLYPTNGGARQAFFLKKASDGFSLLRVISIAPERGANQTINAGYNYVNPSAINANDGLNILLFTAPGKKILVNYLVIGTMA